MRSVPLLPYVVFLLFTEALENWYLQVRIFSPTCRLKIKKNRLPLRFFIPIEITSKYCAKAKNSTIPPQLTVLDNKKRKNPLSKIAPKQGKTGQKIPENSAHEDLHGDDSWGSDSCYNFANGFALFHHCELSQLSLSCGFISGDWVASMAKHTHWNVF